MGAVQQLRAIETSGMWAHSRVVKREPKTCFANILIDSCINENFWYNDLIGVEVFCQLIFKDYGHGKLYLHDARAVRALNTKIEIGRGFHPADIIIL